MNEQKNRENFTEWYGGIEEVVDVENHRDEVQLGLNAETHKPSAKNPKRERKHRS